jgi:hypothetical protein
MATDRVKEMAVRMARASQDLRRGLRGKDESAGVTHEQQYAHIRAMRPTDEELAEAQQLADGLRDG